VTTKKRPSSKQEGAARVLALTEGAAPVASEPEVAQDSEGPAAATTQKPVRGPSAPDPGPAVADSTPGTSPASASTRASGGAQSTTGIARAIEESFEQLGRQLSKANPRRGSVTQPPPAWQPDEVTLGFAVTTDEAGSLREFPEPTVLATILVAVENDRRSLLHGLAGLGDEEIEAVANLYWPLIVLAGRTEPQVAIFDGTGVWKRSFRYTRLPNLEQVPSLLASDLGPAEYLDRLRKLAPLLAHDEGAEVLTVEGFLPVDPPLLFDVLSQSEFRSDPQSPHAGFLPARHDVAWYHTTLNEMGRWLDRFDADLETLRSVRERLQAKIVESVQRIDSEYARLQAEGAARVQEATAHSESEIASLHTRHRDEMLQHVVAIRQAQGTVAHSEVSVVTADALASRAAHRRTQGEVHAARRRQAEDQIRRANRVVAESRKEIERIHARERAALDEAVGKVVKVQEQHARTLASQELFRDEFSAAGNDLLQSIDGQVAARTTQKNLLAGYYLPVQSLAGVRVVWFPLWVATLRGPKGIRQLVFPPMRVRSEKRLAQSLKQLFGGVVLPLEPRTEQFDKVLRSTMEDALKSDPWLSTATRELTRAADVLVDPDVLQRLGQGLRELRGGGWISAKQELGFLDSYKALAERRAAAAARSPYAAPAGTLAAPPPARPAPDSTGASSPPRSEQ